MNSLFGNHWHTQEEQQETDHWVNYWLQDQGSLTKSIQQVCSQAFNVKVLIHHFITAPDCALESMQLAKNDRVLHREVVLCDGNETLVFACSLLPEKALQGRFEALYDMGSRPLGHWLFKEPALKRANMQFTQLQGNNPLFERLDGHENKTITGRKTLFTGAESPFLVSEFFLPGLKNRANT
uniref:Probable chorismate pyruvate-lyase n=1 Tax=uncultured Thiotrichaceae bacterium TaxID=298394 RepID=A0A6S6SRZ3_9GAMM|nr:MAG: Chorismate--pyruvate lyase (EC [uncultured Thiotrichaceae bacterium]